MFKSRLISDVQERNFSQADMKDQRCGETEGPAGGGLFVFYDSRWWIYQVCEQSHSTT